MLSANEAQMELPLRWRSLALEAVLQRNGESFCDDGRALLPSFPAFRSQTAFCPRKSWGRQRGRFVPLSLPSLVSLIPCIGRCGTLCSMTLPESRKPKVRRAYLAAVALHTDH